MITTATTASKTKPTAWHRYVDDDGTCAICGATAGRLVDYQREKDGTPRMPHCRHWHRLPTSQEKKDGIQLLVKARGYDSADIRVVRGKMTVHEPPPAIVKAVAYVAAGKTCRAAARAAGIKPERVTDYRRRHPAIYAMLDEQATCIAKVLEEREPSKPEPRCSREPDVSATEPDDFAPGPLAETEGEGMTLLDFFENVYRPLRLLDCSPQTIVQYRVCIRGLSRLEAGKSVATVNKARTHLVAAWRFAVKRKLITEVPCIDPIRARKRVPDSWSIEEFSQLLKTASETPGRIDTVPAGKFWLALLLTLYDTGLRVGAAIQLERDALLPDGWLYVPAAVQKQRADQRFQLHPDTVAALQDMRQAAIGNMLFPWPYQRGTLFKRLKKILVRAGLPSGRRDAFHKIRRTAATAVADKLGAAAAQAFLDHSAMSVTQMYLDPSRIHRVQTVDVVPRPLLPTAKGGVSP